MQRKMLHINALQTILTLNMEEQRFTQRKESPVSAMDLPEKCLQVVGCYPGSALPLCYISISYFNAERVFLWSTCALSSLELVSIVAVHGVDGRCALSRHM